MIDSSNRQRWILISAIAGALAGAMVGIGPNWPEILSVLSRIRALDDLPSVLYWTLLGLAVYSFQWALLGAVVGGATAWLLVRWNPGPRALFSAVIAASSLAVAVPAGQGWWWGFRVSEVSVRAEPSDYAGPCPATLKFVARITVEGGAGIVSYRLPREERFRDKPYEVAEGSIRFESPGTKEVASDVTVGKEGRTSDAGSTLQIDIREPRTQWVKAEYRIRCTSLRELRESEKVQARPRPLPEGRWTLRVAQAWRSDEIEAYGPEGTALRRPEPGKAWLELLIDVAAPSTSAGLTFGEMALVDEAGVSHTAAAIAGPAPQGLVRPRFLFLEEAFKPWQDPIRPSSISTWLYSYEEGQRSEISYIGSDRNRVFDVTRAGRVKVLSEKPARMFLLFAPPPHAKQFELRLGEHARAAVDRISTPDWTSAAFAPRAGRSAVDRKRDEARRKAQIAGWAKACDEGGVQACYGIGGVYRDGLDVPKDLARAAAAFQKACDAGELGYCVNLGVMYARGSGVPKDLARAAALYKQACDEQHIGGCRNLGIMYRDGSGVPKDPARAVALFKQVCEQFYRTCVELGYMYQNGQGVPRDPARAAELYKKGCDGGDEWGCASLGWMYWTGTGVAKDEARALALLQQACQRGSDYACQQLKRR